MAEFQVHSIFPTASMARPTRKGIRLATQEGLKFVMQRWSSNKTGDTGVAKKINMNSLEMSKSMIHEMMTLEVAVCMMSV